MSTQCSNNGIVIMWFIDDDDQLIFYIHYVDTININHIDHDEDSFIQYFDINDTDFNNMTCGKMIHDIEVVKDKAI